METNYCRILTPNPPRGKYEECKRTLDTVFCLESVNELMTYYIKGISPVAWQHVNLYGTFEFTKSQTKVDIDALAAIFDEEFWKKVQKDADNKDDLG